MQQDSQPLEVEAIAALLTKKRKWGISDAQFIKEFGIRTSIKSFNRWTNHPTTDFPLAKALVVKKALLHHLGLPETELMKWGRDLCINHHHQRIQYCWIPRKRDGYVLADEIARHMTLAGRMVWLGCYLPPHLMPPKVYSRYLNAVECFFRTGGSFDRHHGFTMHHAALRAFFSCAERTEGERSLYLIRKRDILRLVRRGYPFNMLTKKDIRYILGHLLDEVINGPRSRIHVLDGRIFDRGKRVRWLISMAAIGDDLLLGHKQLGDGVFCFERLPERVFAKQRLLWDLEADISAMDDGAQIEFIEQCMFEVDE